MNFNLNKYPTKNIEYICKLDVKSLQNACVDYVCTSLSNRSEVYQSIINFASNTFVDYSPTESKVKCNFNNEIYDFLRHQDLHIYLGIEQNYFNCFIHNDNLNSASIFQKDDGGWIYKCFSKDCKFKIGDINKLTECLTGLNRPETLEFLKSVYGIILEKNEWQIKQEQIIESNIELLLDVDNLKYNYPELFKRINNYIPQLLILHEFAKRNLSLEQVISSNYVTFTAPLKKISNELISNGNSGSYQTVSKRNNVLVFIGMLLKLSDDMVLPEQLQKVKDYALTQGFNNYENFYALPSYNYETLNNVEEKSLTFKESGITMRGFTREMLAKGFGKDEVHKVYPHQENKKINSLNEHVGEIIKNEIMRNIQEKGYCLEKTIYTNGYFIKKIKNKFPHSKGQINKKYVETVFKIYLPELINSYDLKRSRLNKDLKEQFKIENIKGSPNILYLN